MKSLFVRVKTLAGHPLAKGSAIVFIGTMVSNFGAYLYHLLVGRILGPVSYGELASLFSFSYLLNVPSIVLQTILTRYVAGYKAKQELGHAKSLMLSAVKGIVMAVIIGSVILLPFTGAVASFLHIRDSMLLLIVYFTSLILLITTVLTSVLQGFQLFTSVMIFANIGVFLRLAGGVIGASAGVSPAIIAGLITTGVSCVLFLIPLRFVFRVKSKPSGVSLGHALGYAVPTLIAILGITSLYSTDILLAKHYLPELDAGYYAALSVMGKIVFFASSSIAFVLLPVVAERAKQGVSSHRLTYGALAAIAVVSGIITAGYFLLPTVALRLLFGQSYYPAAPYLGMFGLFMTFYSLANGLLTTLLGEGRTRAWIIVACGALLEIAGIALYHSSLTAIILTDTLSAFAMFIALLLYYRHAGKKH